MSIFGNLNNLYLQANKSKKYSNDTLFNRRETENSSKIGLTLASSRLNSSINRPYSSTLKTSLFNRPKRPISKISQKKSLYLKKSPKSAIKRIFHEENYFFKNSSKTSQNSKFKCFIELERYYHPKANMKKNKFKNNFETLDNICNDNIDYISTIYLTETNVKKKPLEIRDIMTKTNNENTLEITNYNYSNHKNADILTIFMNDRLNYNRNEDLKTEYKDRIITCKTKKINIKKESNHEFSEKIRKQRMFKFSMKAKEELCLRIQEKRENELGYLNDKIESFNIWKKLTHDFFTNKIDEYLKFLMYQKAYEKNKLEDLEEEIITIKNDITKINTRMAKIEVEKGKILRWVYLQIKLKEKKVILPIYYKLIMENINDVTAFYESKTKKLANSTIVKTQENIKPINNLSLSVNKKKDKLKKSLKKPKIFSILDNSNNPNLKNDFINFLNKKEGKETYNKIKEYKNNLIYTIEEFSDRMSSLQRENLLLIGINTNLSYKIKDLKSELDKVNEQHEKIFGDYYYNINIKENELNKLKISNSAMENIINVFNSLYSYKILNKSRRRRTSLFNDEPKIVDNEFMQNDQMIPQITLKKNKSKSRRRKKTKKVKKELLFEKVTKLYNICRTIQFKEPKHYEILKEKEKILKNFGILFSIFYIEYCVNYLVDYARNFELNNKDGKKKMRKILFEIEREHREEKAEEMRNQRFKKQIKLEKEINRKNNKIYLHNRQINIPVKKKKKIVEVKQEKIIPSFEDFIYDSSSEEFNYSH